MALAIAGVRQQATSVAQEPAASFDIADLNKPKRLPLSLVPADSVFAISVRPQLLANAGYDPIVEMIDDQPPLKAAGVSVRDVAEALVAVRAQENAGERFVLRFNSPDACLALTQAIVDQAPEDFGKRGAMPKVMEMPSQRITRVDPSTLMFERYAPWAKDGADLPPLHSNVSQQWENEWRQRDDDHLVAAISVAALRQSMSPADRARLMGEFPLQAVTPALDHTDWAVLGAQLDNELAINALAQCEDADRATQIAGIVQALLPLGGAIVEQQQRTALAMMEQNAEPADAAKYRPLLERTFAIATDFTRNAKPVAEGRRVKLAYRAESVGAEDVAIVTQTLMPALQAARTAARRTQSVNNLRLLALAMITYESANGHLPPAVLYKQGSPHPYSWRVALLPYLEQQALYDAYNFDEPWDSEANKRIAETVVPVFASPFESRSPTYASYFVLTGPDTLFSGKEGVKIIDIVDGSTNTVLIVEAKRDIPWTKPEDIPYAADQPLPEFGGWMPGLFQAAFCDAHVELLTQDIDPQRLRKFITKAGREPIRR